MKKAHYAIPILLLILNTFTVQAQNHLSNQQKNLVAISSLTATANIPQLKLQLAKGLDEGLSINEIKEALVQLYAYCGFPRSLNAINTFKTVLDERKASGISDREGQKIIENDGVADKYEQGRKVLEELTKIPQPKPAPGFGEFAPRIDSFLKEHLFADIFASQVLSYQQRELVTIAALSSMDGVEAQLQSHIGMGKNTGITNSQLAEVAGLINVLKKDKEMPGSTENSFALSKNDMLIRIAEIEIFPEMLEKYKEILRENAAKSVQSEAGVWAIFPMSGHKDPAQLRIVEIYASEKAYQSHLLTPHFKHYKTSTAEMVKSLKLIDMEAVDPEMMGDIFVKIKVLD